MPLKKATCYLQPVYSHDLSALSLWYDDRMTKHTHELAAICAVSYWFLSSYSSTITWQTLFGIGTAAVIGGIIPDIDNVASPAWKYSVLPWEDDQTREFLHGHRHISHSVLGVILFTFVTKIFLNFIHIPSLDTSLIIEAFVVGILSHLLTDSLTIAGVPWLYPIPVKFGFPPFAFLRIKTGGWIEELAVFPVLIVSLVWIFYVYRSNILQLLLTLK